MKLKIEKVGNRYIVNDLYIIDENGVVYNSWTNTSKKDYPMYVFELAKMVKGAIL